MVSLLANAVPHSVESLLKAESEAGEGVKPSNSTRRHHKKPRKEERPVNSTVAERNKPVAESTPLDMDERTMSPLIEARMTTLDQMDTTMELCLVCNSSVAHLELDANGSAFYTDEHVVFCHDCGEAYHTFCLDPPVTDKSFLKPSPSEWRCAHCKFCVLCQEPHNESQLVVCDLCDRCFHSYCAKLTDAEIDGEQWLCSDCRVCANCHTPYTSVSPQTPAQRRYSLCLDCDKKYEARIVPLADILRSMIKSATALAEAQHSRSLPPPKRSTPSHHSSLSSNTKHTASSAQQTPVHSTKEKSSEPSAVARPTSATQNPPTPSNPTPSSSTSLFSDMPSTLPRAAVAPAGALPNGPPPAWDASSQPMRFNTEPKLSHHGFSTQFNGQEMHHTTHQNGVLSHPILPPSNGVPSPRPPNISKQEPFNANTQQSGPLGMPHQIPQQWNGFPSDAQTIPHRFKEPDMPPQPLHMHPIHNHAPNNGYPGPQRPHQHQQSTPSVPVPLNQQVPAQNGSGDLNYCSNPFITAHRHQPQLNFPNQVTQYDTGMQQQQPQQPRSRVPLPRNVFGSVIELCGSSRNPFTMPSEALAVVIGENGAMSFPQPPIATWRQIFELSPESYRLVCDFFRGLEPIYSRYPAFVIPGGQFPVMDECPSPDYIMQTLLRGATPQTLPPYLLGRGVPVPSGTLLLPPREMLGDTNPPPPIQANSFGHAPPQPPQVMPTKHVPQTQPNSLQPNFAPPNPVQQHQYAQPPVPFAQPTFNPPGFQHPQPASNGTLNANGTISMSSPTIQARKIEQSPLNVPKAPPSAIAPSMPVHVPAPAPAPAVVSVSAPKTTSKASKQETERKPVRGNAPARNAHAEVKSTALESVNDQSRADTESPINKREKRKRSPDKPAYALKELGAKLTNLLMGPAHLFILSPPTWSPKEIDVEKIPTHVAYKHVGYAVPEKPPVVQKPTFKFSSFTDCAIEHPCYKDRRLCVLCREIGDHVVLGRLLPMQLVDQWVHAGCALWTAEIHPSEDGELTMLCQALRKAKKVSCACCKRTGASVACAIPGCGKRFHLPCLLSSPSRMISEPLVRYAICPDHATRFGSIRWPASGVLDMAAALPLEPAANDPPGCFSMSCFDTLFKLHLSEADLRQRIAKNESEIALAEWTNYIFRSGALTVTQLGTISTRGPFHNQSHIFPPGYRALRRFWSWAPSAQSSSAASNDERNDIVDSSMALDGVSSAISEWEVAEETKLNRPFRSTPPRCTYEIRICEEDPKIKFIVTCSDDPTNVLISRDMGSLWNQVLERVNRLRSGSSLSPDTDTETDTEPYGHADGLLRNRGCMLANHLPPTFFLGLELNHIASHIERLPGAKQLANYKRKHDMTIRLPAVQAVAVARYFDPEAYPDILTMPPNESGAARCQPYVPLTSMARFRQLDTLPCHPASALIKFKELARTRSKFNQPLYPLPPEGHIRSSINPHNVGAYSKLTRFRLMKASEKIRLKVLRSKIQGRGLFVMEDTCEGEFLIEYVGEVITHRLADEREKRYQKQGIGCYMFSLSKDFVIDATFKGNQSRFINHSCEPNCETQIEMIEGTPRIVIFAKHALRQGEELTYDYHFEPELEKLECFCGAPTCRGYMN